jgi:PAS domain S-box-containing protein
VTKNTKHAAAAGEGLSAAAGPGTAKAAPVPADAGASELPGENLLARAEAAILGRADSADDGPVDPETARRTLHQLRVHQVELDMQNEELRRSRAELETSRARYFDLYHLAPVGYLTLDERGMILESNLTAAGLLGAAKSSLVTQPLSRFIAPEDQDLYYQHRRQLLETRTPQVCTVRMHGLDGSWWRARLDATVVAAGDGRLSCRVVMSDVTEQAQLADAQAFLLECGLPGKNEDFFGSLARFLATTLDMDYVCIDRLDGDGLAAQTLAVFHDGVLEPNVAYTLKDTPCGDVVGKTICCFPSGVRHLFPRDAALQELNAESYVGTTLWSFKGRPIGLIAVIGRKPLSSTRLAESLLTHVATRAAGELERQSAEETLRRLLLSTSVITGEAFFETLVRELAQWTSMRWTVVSEIGPDLPDLFVPLSFWEGGRLRPQAPSAIPASPGQAAIAQGFVFIPAEVAALYPGDASLRESGVQSYVGVGLYDHQRQPVGVLASFHDRAVESLPANARDVLAIFGQRAAAELMRLRAERALQRRAQELETFNDALAGRETRVIELKEEVNRLSVRLGLEPPYPPVWETS